VCRASRGEALEDRAYERHRTLRRSYARSSNTSHGRPEAGHTNGPVVDAGVFTVYLSVPSV